MAIKLFDGYSRKVVPVFVVLSFFGWILFVAGFGKEFKGATDEIDDNRLYPYWAGSVLGPIVYILAVVHALLWGFPSAIVGSVTAALSMMYITAVSAVLIATGILINNSDADEIPDYIKMQFAGGFLTTFFWTFVLALWPWYKIDVEGQYSGF